MRILLVNWQDRENPQAGGAEVHLHEIFGRVAAAGHEVHLLCSGWRGAPREVTVDGMRVHRVSGRHGFALAGRGAFRALSRTLGPDVVVEDVNKVPLFLPAIWKGPFVLLVPHLFGTSAFRELPWPAAAVVWASERPMPRAYGRVDVHAISEATRADLVARGFRSEAIRVIHPGVDADRHSPAPGARAPEPLFLYVGRLKRYKQVDVAILALARVRRSGLTAAELWVAGTGDDRDRLEAVARRSGVGEYVRFLGYVSEERKIELYRRAWAVVFPSVKEGWGMTNVEAAACGTPAVASDNSALRESVLDGRTGFLVSTGDVAGFAEAMGRIARDAELRSRLAVASRDFGASFDWAEAARQTLSQLEAAVARGRRDREST